ncbi:MAG: hypothetical protein Q8N05_10075 [Bacteroidota bacterium]|nr:hypothetical protein [Bacteroidota bacterium]
MKGFRILGLSFFLALIVGCTFFASHMNSVGPVIPDVSIHAETTPSPEIQNPVAPFYNVIEVNSFSQTITEVHRLMSVLVLSNRIVPLNHDFRSIVFIPVIVNFSSPVSIFIRGHSLLN